VELVFRDARASDLTSVTRHVERAYRGDASRVGWTTEADLLDGQRTDLEALAELLTVDGSRLVLAHVTNQLVGSMLLSEEADALYLGMLAVRPSAQGSGIGRQLLCEAERAATRAHLPRVRMTVIAQRTELIAWYERRGYRRTGVHEPFPYGDPRFGAPRRPDLYFEVLEKLAL
jgi:ribosomal protein S18 acetylase RimI-like enzyme